MLTLCDCDLDCMMFRYTEGRVKVFGPKSKIVGEWVTQRLEIFMGCVGWAGRGLCYDMAIFSFCDSRDIDYMDILQ